jgi:hypothetical protein
LGQTLKYGISKNSDTWLIGVKCQNQYMMKLLQMQNN